MDSETDNNEVYESCQDLKTDSLKLEEEKEDKEREIKTK